MADDKTFYLNSGKTFKDLKGLAKELTKMTEDVYKHHVNPHKNDFENWVKHSLKKEELATRIEGQIKRIELELEVLRHLVHDAGKEKKRTTVKKVVKASTKVAKSALKKAKMASSKKVEKPKRKNPVKAKAAIKKSSVKK